MFNARSLWPWTFIARSSVISEGRKFIDRPLERFYTCFEDHLYGGGGHYSVNSLYQLLLACLRHDAEREEVEPMSKSCTNLVAPHDCLANRSRPARADNRMMDGGKRRLLACHGVRRTRCTSASSISEQSSESKTAAATLQHPTASHIIYRSTGLWDYAPGSASTTW